MPTPSNLNTNRSSGSPVRRSGVERSIVWGLVLVLLILGGIEVYAQKSFEWGYSALQDRLEKLEKGNNASASLTSEDVRKILGKNPEFSGNPGQIQTNSHYYEAYVWKSILKREFVSPPTDPEMVDTNAIFSGSIPPEKVKYRTPGLDKNLATPESFFSAYTIYVYYGPEDKHGVREVVNILQKREPYLDETLNIPDAAELKRRHDSLLALSISDASRNRKTPLTEDEKERMDPWKYPQGSPAPATPAKSRPTQSPSVNELPKQSETPSEGSKSSEEVKRKEKGK